MKKKRKDIQIFSLSFLDCICCGFGAVIFLFVLSKFAEPLIIEEIKEDLNLFVAILLGCKTWFLIFCINL